MLFNSFAYAIFLPVVFALYWVLRDQYRWILLLLASYFFYMCSGPEYGLLIFGVTLVSYLAAIMIEGSSEKSRKKAALICAVLVCMGLLFFFKYFNFFSSTVNSFLGGGSGYSARSHSTEYSVAGRHFILYIPDNELRHRCVQGSYESRVSFWQVRRVCFVLSSIGGWAYRKIKQSSSSDWTKAYF